MVRVDLSYNPYLFETEVLFNGIPPRINSQVEKYRDKALQTWIDEIPSIFYEEMNGYDFDLYFTGTDLDFEELRKAFQRKNVTEDQVRFFHKGELLGRMEKVQAIDHLLTWLRDSKNNNFNGKEFFEKYKDLFEGAYSFVVIGEPLKIGKLFDDIEVSVEYVDSADELKNMDLGSIPILFRLDQKTSGLLQHNLQTLLKKSGIKQEQLFFIISPELSDKLRRVIIDLGVSNPQIVQSLNDSMIRKYLEIFSISEYIHDAIVAFSKVTNKVGKELRKRNKKFEVSNNTVHNRIVVYDDLLRRLKIVNDQFTGRDNLNLPIDFTKAKFALSANVNRWKIKKVKMTNIEEAKKLSREYEKEIINQFERFTGKIHQIYNAECDAIKERCENWYREGDLMDCDISGIKRAWLSEYTLPDIADELMKIKNERYVLAKEDILDKFFKASDSTDVQNMVLETNYSYEDWREYAISLLEPISEQMIREAYYAIQDYYNLLCEA